MGTRVGFLTPGSISGAWRGWHSGVVGLLSRPGEMRPPRRYRPGICSVVRLLDFVLVNPSSDHLPLDLGSHPLSRLSVMKQDIHPTYFHNCKVFHNGKVVMEVGATVPEMHVEVWSGSHPFFTGKQTFVDTTGRVERFQKKFGGDYFAGKAKAGK